MFVRYSKIFYTYSNIYIYILFMSHDKKIALIAIAISIPLTMVGAFTLTRAGICVKWN